MTAPTTWQPWEVPVGIVKFWVKVPSAARGALWASTGPVGESKRISTGASLGKPLSVAVTVVPGGPTLLLSVMEVPGTHAHATDATDTITTSTPVAPSKTRRCNPTASFDLLPTQLIELRV